jgi:DNA-nicking Smr family endonuclease
MRSKPMPDEGGTIWREAMRDVTPLRGRVAPVRVAPSRPVDTAPPPDKLPAGPSARAAAPPLDSFAGVDRANAERLKRGLHPIAATLDLHGMRQPEAHRRLASFVEESREAGHRCILVITGRGLASDGPGILKRSVPRWLAESGLRRHVLAIAAAQPRHGGAGALYLLLRRRR